MLYEYGYGSKAITFFALFNAKYIGESPIFAPISSTISFLASRK